jgi:hypothetical protein
MNTLCKRNAAIATHAVWSIVLTMFSGYGYSQCTRTITGPSVANIIVLTGETVCVNTDLVVTGDVEVEGGGTLQIGPRIRLVAASVTSWGRVVVGDGSYLYVQSGALFDGPISSITLNRQSTVFVCNGVNVSGGGRVYMNEGAVFDSFHSNFLMSSNYIQYVGAASPAMRPYFISRASIVLQGTLSNSAELGYCPQFPGANLTQARLGAAQVGCTPIVPAIILQSTHCNIISPFYFAALLPVSFQNFSAHANGEYNQVSWSVDEDNTVQHYEVERGEQNSTYQAIATVRSEAGAIIRREYSYVDSLRNSKGTGYYYRVKAVRWNGSSFYSAVRRVQNRGTGDVLRISPNPVISSLNISMPADRSDVQPVQLQVVNGTGRTLYSETFNARRTFFTVPDEIISRMAAGQYYVRITTGERMYVSRFLKQ